MQVVFEGSGESKEGLQGGMRLNQLLLDQKFPREAALLKGKLSVPFATCDEETEDLQRAEVQRDRDGEGIVR